VTAAEDPDRGGSAAGQASAGPGGNGAIVDCAHYRGGRRLPGAVPLEQAGEVAAGGDGFVWIGLREPSDADIAEVAEEFDLPPLAVEDAVRAHQRPKVEVYDNVLFVVLKPAEFTDGRLEVSELALFVGDGFVVIVRHGPSNVLRRVRAAVDGGDGEATVKLSASQKAAMKALVERTASRPDVDPVTGADLGAGPGAGTTTPVEK